jgi:hypothetical protein
VSQFKVYIYTEREKGEGEKRREGREKKREERERV